MRTTIGRFSSTTLAGEPLVVPDDLGRPTLLVFAYQQRQQADVDTWLRALPPDDTVRVLEVPVIARRWALGRRLIDGGMASNMDPTTREQTMCVYTDVASFRADTLGVESTEVLAVLVDASGTVHWHALGPAGADDGEDLRAVLRALRGRG